MKRNRQRARRRPVLTRRIALTEREIAADLYFPSGVQIRRDSTSARR